MDLSPLSNLPPNILGLAAPLLLSAIFTGALLARGGFAKWMLLMTGSAAILASLLGTWRFEDGLETLSLPPSFLLLQALLAFVRLDLSPRASFALCFWATLAADSILAFEHVPGPPVYLFTFGLGGGGLADGLLIYPVLSALFSGYVRWRRAQGTPAPLPS